MKRDLKHHLQFHLAFECDDPDLAASKLIEKGASFIEKCPGKIDCDYLVVLNDPWGNCIQLLGEKKEDLVLYDHLFQQITRAGRMY